MKSAILLLVLSVVVFSSCTTAYKTGQTPDDVYYSPARPQDEYVQSEKKDDQYRYNDDYYEDRYLRMKVSNRYRWRELDDWYNADYRYRYTVYTGCCFCNDPWTPQVYWNSYYNPYYNHYSYGTVKTVAFNKPRTFNLNTYTPTANNTKQSSNKYRSTTNNNSYTESRNNNSNSGNLLRNIFNGNNNSGGNKNNSNTSSGSSGNNNSGSSGSSAPVRRF